MKYRQLFDRLLLAVGLACALSCLTIPTYGWEKTAASRSTDQAEVEAYTPNYAADLKDLLHWSRFPVRIAFKNAADNPARKLDATVLAGFDNWVRATDEGVRYLVVSDPKQADITVTYKLIATEPCNGGELGVTGYSYNPRTLQLREATIHLNIWPHMNRSDLIKLQNAATHEFGHALGIDGHSRDRDDIMYYMTSTESGLSIRDVNTLKVAYHGFRQRR